MRSFSLAILLVFVCTLSIPARAADLFNKPATQSSLTTTSNTKSETVVPFNTNSGSQKSVSEEKKQTPSKASASATTAVRATAGNGAETGQTFRRLSFNAEAMFFRGDLRAQYEVPAGNDLTWIYGLHINPVAKNKDITGDYGIFGAARFYIEKLPTGPFVQLGLGLDHYPQNGMALATNLGIGYVYTYKKNIVIEPMIYAHRAYVDSQKDLMLYLAVNLGINLDHKLFF